MADLEFNDLEQNKIIGRIQTELATPSLLTNEAKELLLGGNIHYIFSVLSNKEIIDILKSLNGYSSLDLELKKRLFQDLQVFDLLVKRLTSIHKIIKGLNFNGTDYEIRETIFLNEQFLDLLTDCLSKTQLTTLIEQLGSTDLKERLLTSSNLIDIIIDKSYKNGKYEAAGKELFLELLANLDTNQNTGDSNILVNLFTNKDLIDKLLEKLVSEDLIFILRSTQLKQKTDIVRELFNKPKFLTSIKEWTNFISLTECLEGLDSSSEVDVLIKKEILSDTRVFDSIFEGLHRNSYIYPDKIQSFFESIINFAVQSNDIDLFKSIFEEEKHISVLLERLSATEFLHFIRNTNLKERPELVEKMLQSLKIKDKIKHLNKDSVDELKEFDSSNSVDKLLKGILFSKENLKEILDTLKINDEKYLLKLLCILLDDASKNQDNDMIDNILFDDKLFGIILEKLDSTSMIELMKRLSSVEIIDKLLINQKFVDKFKNLKVSRRTIKCITDFDLSNPVHMKIFKLVLKSKNLLEVLDIVDKDFVFYKYLKDVQKSLLKNSSENEEIDSLLDEINEFLAKAEDESVSKITISDKLTTPRGDKEKLFLYYRGSFVIARSGDFCESNIDKGKGKLVIGGNTEYIDLPRRVGDNKFHHQESVYISFIKLGVSKDSLNVDDHYVMFINKGTSIGFSSVIIEGKKIQFWLPKKISIEQLDVLHGVVKSLHECEEINETGKKFELLIAHDGEEVKIAKYRPTYIEDFDTIIKKYDILEKQETIKMDNGGEVKTKKGFETISIDSFGNCVISDSKTIISNINGEKETKQRDEIPAEENVIKNAMIKLGVLSSGSSDEESEYDCLVNASESKKRIFTIQTKGEFVQLFCPTILSEEQQKIFDVVLQQMCEKEKKQGIKYTFNIIHGDSIIDNIDREPISTRNVKAVLLQENIIRSQVGGRSTITSATVLTGSPK